MDIDTASAALEAHFRKIHAERMRDMPLLNHSLDVCAVGFQAFDTHAVGVLITPWFMNLVMLPGTAEWSGLAQGSVVKIAFPGSEIEFNVSQDDEFGTHLGAALFSSVADFPDQETAVAIAEEILNHLFRPSDEKMAAEAPTVNRRELLTRLGAG